MLPLSHGMYGAPRYLKSMPDKPDVILFRSEQSLPEWVSRYFPNASIVLRTDNLITMRAAVAAGLGLARMPCFEGDSEPGIRRIDEPLTPSTWGVWILSHVDLRSTARVRVSREFLTEISLEKQSLILGENSTFA